MLTLSTRARIATTLLSFTGRYHQQTKAFGLSATASRIPFSNNLSSRAMSTSTSTSTSTPSTTNEMNEDPYLWLEEVESEQSLSFAKEANEKCLSILGDPKSSGTNTYENILSILESDDRIAYASQYGVDGNDEPIMMNLWKDSNNPKGLWRKTTLESYRTDNPKWETVLDIDELAKKDDISWVWKGTSSLPRSRDPMSNGGKRVTRSLLSLSRGGADATHIKEFDLLKQEFVSEEDGGFVLPEAKTRVSYKSRDVLLVGSNFGEGSLTDSGYPRVVKEWTRGTKIEDAPIVFEGEKTDVSVSSYINDQRSRNGPIYEIRSRSLTFYTTKRWVRRLEYDHLLAANDPARENVSSEPEEFIEVDVQPDAGITLAANMLLISLRSDWEPIVGGTKFSSGSLLYVDAETFLTKGKEACEYTVVFEPTDTTALEDYTFTKNYFIVTTMDNVKSKLSFYKIDNDGSALSLVGGDKEAKILNVGAGAVDALENDLIWYYTSGYTQPSALSLGDASLAENSLEENGYILEKIKSLPDMYDNSGLIVQQKFATSEDGTKIPYFIVSKEGLPLDGNTPTLLYGYGGFEIALGPKYIGTVGKAWLERGGVYVEANIRGGGEFGPKWHQAALKEKRHKAYEDFIAIGEDLIENKICTSKTLAARGGSNGGLLMGMMYTSRPDLFGAIHCAVPLLDMKRFHLLLAGASWVAEYGDPSTDWENHLHKYSPYHLIDENSDYPPMLVSFLLNLLVLYN